MSRKGTAPIQEPIDCGCKLARIADRSGDLHRNRQQFERKSIINDLIDTTVQPWIYGFVHSVGTEHALHLLQGVGDLSLK